MKKLIFSAACLGLLTLGQATYAAPAGDIVFYNASQKTVTAQVSSVGRFNLAANQTQRVPYSSLMQACSSTPTHCRAQFYVDNRSAGSATINAMTGRLVSMNLAMKVRTGKSQQILRSVIIH